ncbi:MAG: hypothetical protein GZ094_19175 [Mariniphaga sp.]|nr:hypothetical protein [Mariniphaga sp.]
MCLCFRGTKTLAYLNDFPGKVKQTKQSQTFNSVTTKVNKYYDYDHAGRLKTTEQQITGDANGKVTVSENNYNEIGQLIDKKLHKTNTYDYVQSVGYTYNIRGWLEKINNPDVNLSSTSTQKFNLISMISNQKQFNIVGEYS